MDFESVCREIGGKIDPATHACIRKVDNINDVVRYIPIIYKYLSKCSRDAEFVFEDLNKNRVEIEYRSSDNLVIVRVVMQSRGVEAKRVREVVDTAIESIEKIPKLGIGMIAISIPRKEGGRVTASTYAYVYIERSRITPQILNEIITRLIKFAMSEARRAEKKLIKTRYFYIT